MRIALILVRHCCRVLSATGLAVRDITQSCALWLCLVLTPDFFDDGYYERGYGRGRKIRYPRARYAFRGARKLENCNAWFSQEDYLVAEPRIGGRGILPVLHYLLLEHGREKPGTGANGNRWAELWPAIQADMRGIRDQERHLSGAPLLGDRFAAATSVPAPAVIGRPLRAFMERMPSRIEHLVLVPWLGILGGSEKVSQRLIRVLVEHYRPGDACVLGPDSIFDLTPEQRRPYGLPIHALGDIGLPDDDDVRAEFLDRVILQLRPRTIHCINSAVGWKLLQQRAGNIAYDSNIFGTIYSNIRVWDGVPVGAFWDHLPDCFDHLAGVISDNRTVVKNAKSSFAFTSAEMERFHVVYTPVVGFSGKPAADMRPFRRGAEHHSLWMSRIALEKRLEVLVEVSKRMPEHRFSIFGARVKGAFPVKMNEIHTRPNISVEGEYSSLDAVPFDRFSSYIFTTTAEGLPIALLEVAQYGLPIVAPDIGGIGEFIDDTTGWLVDEPDIEARYVRALTEIEAHPDLAAQKVAAAQQRLVERHSWDVFKRTVENIPGYLVGEPATGRTKAGLHLALTKQTN